VTARSAGDEDADQRARHGSRTHKLDRGRRLRVHPAASAVCAPAAAWAGAVLGQVGVDAATQGKGSEINQFVPLLDTLTDVDLPGVVITADALHTQREHVADLHARGAHWVLTVKGNQPSLHRQLAKLPWKAVAEGHRSVETGHGRREIRTLKVVTIATGIAFPHARQAIQVTRRARSVSTRTGRKGRLRTETVYAITDLAPHQADLTSSPRGSAGTGRSRTACTGYAM